MSGITYPSGPQLLRIPTTILLPSTATPFNPNAVNPSVEQCWDSIKALEYYGFFPTTFDATKPPYPAGGSFFNSGTYQLNGKIRFNTSGTPLEHTSARTYARVAHLHAYANPTYWELAYNDAPPKGYYRNHNFEANASNSGLVFDFDLPSNCTITRVVIRIHPAVHTNLPDIMPTIFVYLVDVIDETTTLIGSETDSSANITQYNALHTISFDCSQVFDAGRNRLMVKFFSEDDDGNSHSVNNLIAHLPIVEFTRAQIGEEFGELPP